MNQAVIDQTTVIQNWQVIVGFLSPLALSVIIQSKWPRKAQAVCAFAFCAAVTIIGAYLKDEVDWANIPAMIGVVFVATIAAYHGFWQPTGVAGAVESKTNV